MLASGGHQVVLAIGSTSGLTTWIKDNVLGLIILVVGLGMMAGSKKKDHRGSLMTGGILLLGLTLVGIALSGKSADVATWAAGIALG